MSKYEMNTILSMWAQDRLTVEQAVGQVLQHLQALLQRVGQVEQQLYELRREGAGRVAPSVRAEVVAVEEEVVEEERPLTIPEATPLLAADETAVETAEPLEDGDETTGETAV